jgi:methylase of polypeptide subunit release factors
VYDWAAVPEGSAVCDIGSGKGNYTLALLKAFPHLKIVLQDQPNVMQEAKEV